MPDTTSPIILNKGLDTVTHPILAEAGTLIDCLNYEMTDKFGYRRIDGYEAYDGWVAGDLVDYYKLTVSISDGSITASLVPGATLLNAGTGVVLGVIVNYSAPTLTYAPANRETPVVISGTALDVVSGSSRMSASDTATKGSVVDSAATFVDNVRAYSTTLRALVSPHGTPVAGLHWFRNNLIVALDCPVLTYTDSSDPSRETVHVGSLIGYGTTVYRVVHRLESGTSMTLHLEPVNTQASNSSIRVYAEDGVTILATAATASNIALSTDSSDYAYLLASKTPETSTSRGTRSMARTLRLTFANATAAAEADFDKLSSVAIGTGAAKYAIGLVLYSEVISGTYAAGTAAGYLDVILTNQILTSTANRDYITTTDDIYDAGAATKRADITAVSWASIAGTAKLRENTTHYQWITANFYGQDNTTEAYGATGASRAFWATAHVPPTTYIPPSGSIAVDDLALYTWGNIYTDTSIVLDVPKYIAYHGQSLALSIGSSVIRSVGGDPRSYNGTLGATENATGDIITGLLEGQDDSLIVFGVRGIRRLTGVTEPSLKTIVPNAGAFDYSAVTVGTTPVFTGPNGITSLAQAEVYGDFAGERATSSVTNTLIPKLITDFTDSEPGGVVMAMPVRSKNQYRMWLSTGEVYTVTFSSDGPKIMKSNYGFTNEVRVPIAWTSQQADSGKEHIMVAWDDVMAAGNVAITGEVGTLPDEKMVYELDRGWGFNGQTFSHYFDITYSFGDAQALGISYIRLFGMSYGLATLDIKSAGVEDDFDQDYHTTVQDISMPMSLTDFSSNMRPATAIVDQANWGLGVKLRINGTKAENLTTTEPSHICQVLVLHINPRGAKDN